MTEYIIYTLEDRPDLRDDIDQFTRQSWPEFMLNHSILHEYWQALYTRFPACQLILMEAEPARVIGVANSLPLHWSQAMDQLPDNGLDWCLSQGIKDADAGVETNLLCIVSISLAKDVRGHSRSNQMIDAMKDLAMEYEFETIVSPIRPNFKSLHPLESMETYLSWTNSEGLPFDPWIRVQVREGAEVLHVCPESTTLTGTVAEWEAWTQLEFKESGPYMVPGALVPVMINLEMNQGLYVEPHVWMRYPIFG